MKSNLFVRRPILAMSIAIVIVILGIISVKDLPIEQYPDITPPMVQVSADYLGADALTVEQSVATPIEESVNGVSDMIYMQSTNSGDGTMNLQVTFGVGTNPDMNTIFTQNRVSSAVAQLPAVVNSMGVTTSKSQSSFVQVLALHSDGRYNADFLSNYAMINIKDRLSRIDGVGMVSIMGVGEYAMRIWINPERLDYLGIPLNDVVEAIKSQSGITPGGVVGGEPSKEGTQFTYTVRMPAQYNTAQQFGDVVIRANPNGAMVRLKDVATIVLGSDNYNVSAMYDSKPCALIPIYQAPGSDAVQIGKDVKAAMDELSQTFPDGVMYGTVVDSTATIKSGVKEIVLTLIFALILVIFVIYLFVQDIRATIVPVIAIPVSLIGAFILFPVLGFSINVFSLLGLVLAVGLVVDDAIVVVEAVQHNIELGMTPKQATITAMGSVASPIIATTLVLMAVFLPVGLMAGAAGKLYSQFAITIALSVLISGINALTLSPALCSLLLKKRGDVQRKGFFGWFNRKYSSSVDGYLRFNSVIIRHGGRVVVFIAIVIASSLVLIKQIPTGFLPDEDQGYLLGNIQLPDAASLERTKTTLDDVYKIISSNPDVELVCGAAGFSIMTGTSSPNMGVLFIKLKPYNQRKYTAGELTNIFNGELYEMVNSGQIYVFGPPSIPGLGPGSGFTIMIQDKGGNTPAYLAEYTNKFVAAAAARPEVSMVNTMYSASVPQRAVEINTDKVLKDGVSLEELQGVLSSYLGGDYISNFNRFGKMYRTYLQAGADYRSNTNQISQYYVLNNKGVSVPLSAYVSVKDTVGAQFTTRYNMLRSAGVNGLPASGYSSSQTMAALVAVADSVLPADMGYAWSNMSYQQANSSGEGMIFVYALIFVFLILAALYESWSLPMTIILGVPFAVFGALIFTYGGHVVDAKYINDIFFQVSLIMLIGLAAKNAILIIEYAKDKFDEGMSLVDAAIEGAKLRLRPVLMTAFAFIFGIMPLIFATGSNAVARNIMGLALVGGMLVATLIAIFVYPALFVLIGKVFRYEQKREKISDDEK